MKERISLKIIDDRFFLYAVATSRSARVRNELVSFVIDTGSNISFLSNKDVLKMQASLPEHNDGEIDFGGSRFKKARLPKINIHVLKEGKSREYFTFKTTLYGLKTTKESEKKKEIALELPSVLGVDFLREQKLSLHYISTENMAYLEKE